MKELSRGQKLSIEKEFSNKSFIIALNYNNTSNYDIDASILLLSEREKIEEEDDFIFYNNLNSKCGGIKMAQTGIGSYKNSFNINLDKISANIFRIMLVMTIDNGDSLNQRFENINNIRVDLLDDKNQNIILQYKVTDLFKETAAILIEIYKHNNEWKIQAKGSGFNSGLAAILKEYGSEKIQVKEETPVKQIQEKREEEKQKPAKIPAGTIDFVKKHQSRIDLAKKHVTAVGLSAQKAQVIVVMDTSGSMINLFKEGVVQDTFDRVLPLAMQFDDDGEIDVWLFDVKCIHHHTPYTLDNRENYVKKEILSNHRLGLGTQYANPINEITAHYSLAGKNELPLFVLFFTDGNCSDANQTEKAMINCSSKGIFWKFIGMGGNRTSSIFYSNKLSFGFDFLEKLDDLPGRVVDNANFFQVSHLNDISDDELYKSLLKEFPQWLNDARKHKIIA